MYDLCSGRVPFSAATPQALLVAQVIERPTSLNRALRGTKVPAPLERLVMSLLQKEPDQRPPSASAVMVELRAIVTPGRMRARGVPTWAIAGIIAGVIALAGTAAWLLLEPRSQAVEEFPRVEKALGTPQPVATFPEPPATVPPPATAAPTPKAASPGRKEVPTKAVAMPSPESPMPAAPPKREAAKIQSSKTGGRSPGGQSRRTANRTVREPSEVSRNADKAPAPPREAPAPASEKVESKPGRPKTPPSIWEVFD
jgi:hypothetical protein